MWWKVGRRRCPWEWASACCELCDRERVTMVSKCVAVRVWAKSQGLRPSSQVLGVCVLLCCAVGRAPGVRWLPTPNTQVAKCLYIICLHRSPKTAHRTDPYLISHWVGLFLIKLFILNSFRAMSFNVWTKLVSWRFLRYFEGLLSFTGKICFQWSV